jgi:hypothetical protein
LDVSIFSIDIPLELAGNKSARIGFVLERDDLAMLFSPESVDNSLSMLSLVLPELKISNSGLQLMSPVVHSMFVRFDVPTFDNASWSVVESATTEDVVEGESFLGTLVTGFICRFCCCCCGC